MCVQIYDPPRVVSRNFNVEVEWVAVRRPEKMNGSESPRVSRGGVRSVICFFLGLATLLTLRFILCGWCVVVHDFFATYYYRQEGGTGCCQGELGHSYYARV